MRLLAWIYGFMLIALFPVLLKAQGRVVTLSEIDSVLNPPLLGGKEVLYFESAEMNVGNLSEDDAPVAYHFRFRNVSDTRVELTKVVTSCGCTEANVARLVVNPGEEGEITLVFNPWEQAGTLYKQAFVYTDLSSQLPTAKIALVGKVKPTADKWTDFPYAMGSSLRLRQPEVRIREMERTVVRTERLVCVNSGTVPLKLSALLIPPYASFHTEPEVIQPGEEADLVISLDGRLLPATVDNEFSFPLVMKGIEVRPSDRTLCVKVFMRK